MHRIICALDIVTQLSDKDMTYVHRPTPDALVGEPRGRDLDLARGSSPPSALCPERRRAFAFLAHGVGGNGTTRTVCTQVPQRSLVRGGSGSVQHRHVRGHRLGTLRTWPACPSAMPFTTSMEIAELRVSGHLRPDRAKPGWHCRRTPWCMFCSGRNAYRSCGIAAIRARRAVSSATLAQRPGSESSDLLMTRIKR
jgi:hypothetical protein